MIRRSILSERRAPLCNEDLLMIELIETIFDILEAGIFRPFNFIFIVKIILLFENFLQFSTLFNKNL